MLQVRGRPQNRHGQIGPRKLKIACSVLLQPQVQVPQVECHIGDMGLSDKVLGVLITASAVAIFAYYSVWVLVVVSQPYIPHGSSASI